MSRSTRLCCRCIPAFGVLFAIIAATLFHDLSVPALVSGLAAGGVVGVAGAAIVSAVGWFSDRREMEGVVQVGALDLDRAAEIDGLAKLTRAERNALRAGVRERWTTPALATLERPVMSLGRRVGLFTLRVYLLLACGLVVVKIVQAGTA
jgi:hypothetical protein